MVDIQPRAPEIGSAMNNMYIYNDPEFANHITTWSSVGGGFSSPENSITSNIIYIRGQGYDTNGTVFEMSNTGKNGWVSIADQVIALCEEVGGTNWEGPVTIPSELTNTPSYYFHFTGNGYDDYSEAIPNSAYVTPSIQITCSTPSSQIYYTIDGNEPSSGSNLYSSPFSVNVGTTIKAIGIKEGYLDSDIATLNV